MFATSTFRKVERGLSATVAFPTPCPPMMREHEAANYLGVSVHWMRKDRRKAINELTYYKNEHIRYMVSDLEAFKRTRTFQKPVH